MGMIMLTKASNDATARIVAFVFILLFGLCTIIAAIRNWDWYFNSRKTKIACDLFGRTTVRVINAIIGLVAVVLSVYWLISPNVR